MIKATKLPEELIAGTSGASPSRSVSPRAEKRTLYGIDEIQYLRIAPWTSIGLHGHGDQWEVWVDTSRNTAYVCLIGEKHELVNNSEKEMIVMAIKGHIDYSYEDLAEIFHGLGFLLMII